MSSLLDEINKVDIDLDGEFKYILVKVYEKEEDKGNKEPFVVIVRGYQRCKTHTDVFNEVQNKLMPLFCEVLGGGKIKHDRESKKLNIHGESQGYGKADHNVTAKLLREAYPGYTVTVENESDCTTCQGICDPVKNELDTPLLCNEAIGGGILAFNPEQKTIHLSGKSAYGRTNHELAASLLREAMPEYEITMDPVTQPAPPCDHCKVQNKLKPLFCEVLGGGKIKHDRELKKLNIHGESQGYGKANHNMTAKLLREAFPGYTVTVENQSQCMPCGGSIL